MKSLTLIDWKSSKGIYDEYRIQVAAYAEAYNLKALAEGRPLVERVGVLRLDKETGAPEYCDCTEGMEERFKAFAAVREYFRIMIEPGASGKRFYAYEDRKFPSVTTILGCLDKPALVQWAANSTVEHIESILPELANANPDQVAALLKSAKTAFRRTSKKACDIGTLVHDMIECHLSGGMPESLLDEVGKTVKDKATNSFLAFLEWKDQVHLEPVALEHTVYHPALAYAGTCDAVAWLDLDGTRAEAVA